MSLETQYRLYEEEDLPESQPQINLNDYLKGVLKYFYAAQGWFVTGNLAILPITNKGQKYPFKNLAPDVVVFPARISEAEQRSLTSWNMNEANRPAPLVVFEVSSKDTWQNDLSVKPDYYRLLGIKEYFAYDPQGLWTNSTVQLRGWRYQNEVSEELAMDGQGRLWSEVLQSWLKPDDAYLRLYDQNGNIRLKGEEAALQQIEALREKLRQAGLDPDNL
jgi:Uma2 family endonuclease